MSDKKIAVSGFLLSILFWWLSEPKTGLSFIGEFDVDNGMSVQISRMPYRYAVFMLFQPTNEIESIRSAKLYFDVFDHSGTLVNHDVVNGADILDTSWFRNRYPPGKVMVYKLDADNHSIRLGKSYSIKMNVALNNENKFRKIEVYSERYR